MDTVHYLFLSFTFFGFQAGASVDSFLESLGLEKYSTAFQVEEVCNI